MANLVRFPGETAPRLLYPSLVSSMPITETCPWVKCKKKGNEVDLKAKKRGHEISGHASHLRGPAGACSPEKFLKHRPPETPFAAI